MKKDFHKKAFDESTLVKLEIFKRYLREWLPVFMTESVRTSWCRQINIYDLFCGPGMDNSGNFGTPLIIQNEVKSFCKQHPDTKKRIRVNLFFNDQSKSHVSALKERIHKNRCSENCCQFSYSSEPFKEIAEKHLQGMQKAASANLVFLDQFGVKEVLPETISRLLDAGTTDVLFFISTAAIRRFSEQPEFKRKFNVPSIKVVEYSVVHRHLTEWFKEKIARKDVFFAPFSIKKGSNIYGLVFASKNKLGIEKFLQVCWNLDAVAGEANYNIDNEIVWNGQNALFPEDCVPSKIAVFETELLAFIKKQEPSNKDVYLFGLERGFHSAKCNDALRKLQDAEKIEVVDISTRSPVRKRAFYLKEDQEIVLFKGR